MKEEEWFTATYNDSFTHRPDEKPEQPRPSPWRPWLPVAAAALVLLLVGAATLLRERAAGEAMMRADLAGVIFEEETVRFLNDPDRAGTFVWPGAPSAWQRTYSQRFKTEPGAAPPAAVHVEEIDFDGQCALVSASLDGYPQLRAYCRNGPLWQRAPVPDSAWSGPLQAIDLPGGARLSFRPLDEPFAAGLAADLPPVLARLEELAPAAGRLQDLEIVIEPRDLHSPLRSDNGSRLVLNSPLLAPFQGSLLPSGQGAVRLALAQALLRRAGLAPEPPRTLPGAERFITAAQTVLAAHLLLPPPEPERLAEEWRAGLVGPWLSPFFADLLLPVEPPESRQAELAAYVMAGYILNREGVNTLAAVLQQLPAAESWDALFKSTLQRPTIVLENEVDRYRREGDTPAAAGAGGAEAVAAGLPLPAVLRRVTEQPGGGSVAQVDAPGQAGPLLVELPFSLQFRTAGGAYLPPNCAFPGTRLEVDGDWREVQRRLLANRVMIEEIRPLAIEPAPADTTAFLVWGEAPADDPAELERVFASTQSYLITSRLPVPQALVALRADGTIQPLTPLSPTLQVRPLPATPDSAVQFLFIVDRPGCNFSWFVRYDSRLGLTGQWFVPTEATRWVWRPDYQDLLFFKYNADRDVYDIYNTQDMASLRPMGSSTMPMVFTGWHAETDNLVFVRTWMGTMAIGLLEPKTGSMSRLKLYVHPLRARQLSPDGAWLAYLTGLYNLFDPPYRLDVLNIETREEHTLIQGDEAMRLGPPNWSRHLADSRLAVLAGPLVKGDRLRPTDLLLVSPREGSEVVTVATAGPGEQLAIPVFCSDGSLLYRVDTEDRYRLVRYTPGDQAQTLLTSDLPFLPVACP